MVSLSKNFQLDNYFIPCVSQTSFPLSISLDVSFRPEADSHAHKFIGHANEVNMQSTVLILHKCNLQHISFLEYA